MPDRCQQRTTRSYRLAKGEKRTYDRGHLVPANHMDSSKKSIADSNKMVNVLPQVAQMNRGTWLQTEEIIECYRDTADLHVIGGVIWGDEPSDDHFLRSHGVATPDAYWKVVVAETPMQGRQTIAWIVPNSDKAVRSALDRYLVTPAEIERLAGVNLNGVPDADKGYKPSRSWPIPTGCDKS